MCDRWRTRAYRVQSARPWESDRRRFLPRIQPLHGRTKRARRCPVSANLGARKIVQCRWRPYRAGVSRRRTAGDDQVVDGRSSHRAGADGAHACARRRSGARQCGGRKRFADGCMRSGGDRQVGAHFVRVCQDRLHARQWLHDHRDEAYRAGPCEAVFPAWGNDGCGRRAVGRAGRLRRRQRCGCCRSREDRARAGSRSTEAYGGIKRLFLQTSNRPMESQMEDEAQTLAAISRTADAQEGVRAFKEKRKPKFAGK